MTISYEEQWQGQNNEDQLTIDWLSSVEQSMTILNFIWKTAITFCEKQKQNKQDRLTIGRPRRAGRSVTVYILYGPVFTWQWQVHEGPVGCTKSPSNSLFKSYRPCPLFPYITFTFFSSLLIINLSFLSPTQPWREIKESEFQHKNTFPDGAKAQVSSRYQLSV